MGHKRAALLAFFLVKSEKHLTFERKKKKCFLVGASSRLNGHVHNLIKGRSKSKYRLSAPKNQYSTFALGKSDFKKSP